MRFFFNVTPTTKIYSLTLHEALPISAEPQRHGGRDPGARPVRDLRAPRPQARSARAAGGRAHGDHRDWKSTRLNSSHANISYAFFFLQKKHNYPSSTYIRHTNLYIAS